jgi:hypothetical protein
MKSKKSSIHAFSFQTSFPMMIRQDASYFPYRYQQLFGFPYLSVMQGQYALHGKVKGEICHKTSNW